MKGNHNYEFHKIILRLLCSTSQRYKMKGNHNNMFKRIVQFYIVFNKSKIQNERKSQHFEIKKVIFFYCVQQVKDTK